MTNYTAHYQLHQWEPEDSFLRTDFNEDFAKIDGALGGKAEQSAVDTLAEQVAGKSELVTGSYTGDGEASRTIELGFSPRRYCWPPVPGRSITPARVMAVWPWRGRGKHGLGIHLRRAGSPRRYRGIPGILRL
ncbi:hypothetical protein M5E87_15015 [Flavonifractor plautii]|nr:hypothetical protein M5E87_15015 [Flavonifractor plautii]